VPGWLPPTSPPRSRVGRWYRDRPPTPLRSNLEEQDLADIVSCHSRQLAVISRVLNLPPPEFRSSDRILQFPGPSMRHDHGFDECSCFQGRWSRKLNEKVNDLSVRHELLKSSLAELSWDLDNQRESLGLADLRKELFEQLETKFAHLASMVETSTAGVGLNTGSETGTSRGSCTPPHSRARTEYFSMSPEKLTSNLLKHLDAMRADLGGRHAGSRCQTTSSRSSSPFNDDPRSLFIGGLGPNMTEDDLRCIFGDAGGNVRARVLTDRESGESKRCGFVFFATVADCQAAVDLTRDGRIDYAGCRLRVSPRRRRPRPRSSA
jgi:hypothetical protein